MANQITDALKHGMLDHAVSGTLYHTAASENIDIVFHVHNTDRRTNPPNTAGGGDWLEPHSSCVVSDVAWDAAALGKVENASAISQSNAQDPATLSGTGDRISWVSIHLKASATAPGYANVIVAIDLGFGNAGAGVDFSAGDTISVAAQALDLTLS